MKLIEFYKKYPTEESCRNAFKEMREQTGIKCKKCGNETHYWRKDREEWECKKCRHRTRLRVGTVMENSKLPFMYWFVAMHLITSTKKSISAKELQRQLGHKRYQPIWEMLHKLRLIMGLRDMQYTLGDEVELDEGYFETVSIKRDKDKPLKRGRGSQKQTIVLVSAEAKEIEIKDNKKKYSTNKKVGFIKMKVIESLKMQHITKEVEDMVDAGSKIITDKNNSYNNLQKKYEHEASVIPKEEISVVLPWVHIAIGNAKRLLLDIYHRIDNDFLQSYLNEFCYKFNRRYFNDLFDRLLMASTMFRWNYLGR